ncbi:uncharacterized protein B0H18DRAFT_1122828 [Fomitopsis serialis]|uniref:uncharacterized protein n=1 Tax=Fomitopsis serialis TaxID=139415 RepID=UPI002008C4A9|nr:uncharacterized protein B0H18DRAFT_1122828 [Neoantrodia serialis]KAH9918860.1 hypothetical protein B0H18DRAFT_1122828 [Neoantrodia serialis]
MSNLPNISLEGALLRDILVGSRTQYVRGARMALQHEGFKPVVDKVYPFEGTRAEYEYLENQQHVGKVCVQVARD